MLCFFGGHGRLVSAELAVRQGGPAVDFVDLSQLVQLVQVAPDGGFAGVQGLAQLLNSRGPLTCQQVEDESETFFCQHLRHSSFEGF